MASWRRLAAAAVLALAVVGLSAALLPIGCELKTDGLLAAGDAQPPLPDVLADSPLAMDVTPPDAPPDVAGDAAADVMDASRRCIHQAGGSMTPVGSFCIDATEVSCVEFSQFYDSLDGGPISPPGCPSVPVGPQWQQKCTTNVPVSQVTWCEAYAYCQWAGKHLCGAIDGGTYPLWGTGYKDPNVSEWYSACSRAGMRTYPYGDTPIDCKCNASCTPMQAAGSPFDGGSCSGGYDGVWDMAGNLWEWENSCGIDAGVAYCRIRGGSFLDPTATTACDHSALFNDPATNLNGAIGFRCCADYR